MGKKTFTLCTCERSQGQKNNPLKKTQQIRKEQNYPQLSAKLRKIT